MLEGFGDSLLVMKSMRKPMRMTFRYAACICLLPSSILDIHNCSFHSFHLRALTPFAVAAAWWHALLLACRGSDEREYKFLVKAGEDLRTDARMEQLFEVMNQALAADPACSERSLSLR